MKLLEAQERFEKWLLTRGRSKSTATAYVLALGKYARYLQTRPQLSEQPQAKRVEMYLTHRVTVDDIAPSTQGVELNALIAFYQMQGIELTGINALRAKRRDRIPPIMTKEQVATLIGNFPHEWRLIPQILYGCAMRINECLRLRIKDVDLSLEKLSIHEAKGDKERVIPIPKSLLPLIKIQMDKAISSWKVDVYHKFNGVNCGGIEKKYPSYPQSKEWYWLFPAINLSSHPKTHVPMMRHHVMDYTIQRIFEELRTRHNLPVYTTPHILRHACLTHMAADMIRKGFTETMITAELKQLSGHVNDETLWGYIHLAAPKNAYVVSPIEDIVFTTYSNGVG